MRQRKPRDGTSRDKRLNQVTLTEKGEIITRLFLEVIRQLDGGDWEND